MLPDRLTVVVLAVAAAMGVVLARVAGAGVETHTAAVISGPVGLPPVAPPPIAPAPHDESEAEESHTAIGGAADNPYDEPAAPHPTAVRVPIASQGGMLRLPGGHFVMGSTNMHAPANERPARTVAVLPYWIDRTEVTVGAYRACVDAGTCARPAHMSASCTYDTGDPELPVACVHWRDADAYCRFAGKRLPTELEWEYAARGTNTVPFPWGGLATCANAVTLLNDRSGKSCAARPARVGSHPGGASVFGVQDMSGNVEEWTADWYVESLGPGPAPRTGAAHVLRGGGWLSPPSQSRTTSRNWGSAVEAGPNVGFRCAKDGA